MVSDWFGPPADGPVQDFGAEQLSFERNNGIAGRRVEFFCPQSEDAALKPA